MPTECVESSADDFLQQAYPTAKLGAVGGFRRFVQPALLDEFGKTRDVTRQEDWIVQEFFMALVTVQVALPL